jgi:hypothetical protein
MVDIAELRETATKTPTTTDRELVWAAADRIETLESILRALIAWRDTGETPGRLWSRARDLVQKSGQG